jgi:hypothetical protein
VFTESFFERQGHDRYAEPTRAIVGGKKRVQALNGCGCVRTDDKYRKDALNNALASSVAKHYRSATGWLCSDVRVKR